MDYASVFTNPEHDSQEQVVSDCLRCHGMYFGGDVGDIVTPLDVKGPWRLVDPSLAGRPAIPCLACHQIHRRGEPRKAPDYSQPERIAAYRPARPFAATFYDRRERAHFVVEDLTLPKMRYDGRPVKASPDVRQALCYQCHAPDAARTVGSGDDRTPVGVHEGISCFGCHEAHSLDARNSCGHCHPRESNCGLDVETMDTTFRSPDSPHNSHFVKCKDCHQAGVPRRRK